jgi:HAE1 family hydrophobic/amphiphilic exporter-1
MLNITFNLDRDIDRAAQDVRDRVQSALRRLPQRHRTADDHEAGQRQRAEPLGGAVRQPVESRADEIADKIVKVPLERTAGVGEVQIVGGLERAMSIWVEAIASRLQALDRRRAARACSSKTPTCPGGNVTTDVNERTCARWGRFADARSSTTSSSPRATVRRSACATSAAPRTAPRKQRSFARLNGIPDRRARRAPPVRAPTLSPSSKAAKAALDAIKPRLPADVSVQIIRDQSDAHLRLAARDQRAPDSRQHPRLPGGVCVHARLARHHHCRRRHSNVGDLDIRVDGGARLHAQYRHDARARC